MPDSSPRHALLDLLATLSFTPATSPWPPVKNPTTTSTAASQRCTPKEDASPASSSSISSVSASLSTGHRRPHHGSRSTRLEHRLRLRLGARRLSGLPGTRPRRGPRRPSHPPPWLPRPQSRKDPRHWPPHRRLPPARCLSHHRRRRMHHRRLHPSPPSKPPATQA